MNRLQKYVTGAVMTLSVCALSSGALALPDDFDAKLNSPDRPAEDKARDAARKPRQVLEALGVQEGWTMVDVAAGGGWYTQVQSAAVGPSGTVYMQVGGRGGDAAAALAARLGNVEVVTTGVEEMEAGIADAALTAMNLHDAFNFRGEEGATSMLAGIFHVLKSGGVAAIIDHEGSPGNANGDLHRMVAADARRILEAVGFEIVEESQILHNPADDHAQPSRDAADRNSDRFLFIVRKP